MSADLQSRLFRSLATFFSGKVPFPLDISPVEGPSSPDIEFNVYFYIEAIVHVVLSGKSGSKLSSDPALYDSLEGTDEEQDLWINAVEYLIRQSGVQLPESTNLRDIEVLFEIVASIFERRELITVLQTSKHLDVVDVESLEQVGKGLTNEELRSEIETLRESYDAVTFDSNMFPNFIREVNKEKEYKMKAMIKAFYMWDATEEKTVLTIKNGWDKYQAFIFQCVSSPIWTDMVKAIPVPDIWNSKNCEELEQKFTLYHDQVIFTIRRCVKQETGLDDILSKLLSLERMNRDKQDSDLEIISDAQLCKWVFLNRTSNFRSDKLTISFGKIITDYLTMNSIEFRKSFRSLLWELNNLTC